MHAIIISNYPPSVEGAYLYIVVGRLLYFLNSKGIGFCKITIPISHLFRGFCRYREVIVVVIIAVAVVFAVHEGGYFYKVFNFNQHSVLDQTELAKVGRERAYFGPITSIQGRDRRQGCGVGVIHSLSLRACLNQFK